MYLSKPKVALGFLFVLLLGNMLLAQSVLHPNGLAPDGKGGATETAAPTGQTVVQGNGIN